MRRSAQLSKHIHVWATIHGTRVIGGVRYSRYCKCTRCPAVKRP